MKIRENNLADRNENGKIKYKVDRLFLRHIEILCEIYQSLQLQLYNASQDLW